MYALVGSWCSLKQATSVEWLSCHSLPDDKIIICSNVTYLINKANLVCGFLPFICCSMMRSESCTHISPVPTVRPLTDADNKAFNEPGTLALQLQCDGSRGCCSASAAKTAMVSSSPCLRWVLWARRVRQCSLLWHGYTALWMDKFSFVRFSSSTLLFAWGWTEI